MAVAADSSLSGATIEAIEHQSSWSIFVIGVNRRGGETITRPEPATLIEAGDGVVIIKRSGRTPCGRVEAGIC